MNGLTDVYLYPAYDVDPDDVRLYYAGETIGVGRAHTCIAKIMKVLGML